MSSAGSASHIRQPSAMLRVLAMLGGLGVLPHRPRKVGVEIRQHRFAVVMRGPLAHFTSVAIEWYLGYRNTGVVFSHNTGSCANTSFLTTLRNDHPYSFDWVLRKPPPLLGIGYRNAQREASHHGIALAMRNWSPEFLLVQRPDALFQETDSLPRIAALLQAQLPSDLPNGQGRLALAAGQTVIGDFYGVYHLDDHVVFGRAADVAAYWSVNNPYYCRSCAHSTELPPAILKQRERCRVPGPESELGDTWVRWAHEQSGAPLPVSTEALIAARLVIFEPARFGYVSMLHPSMHSLARTIALSNLPLLPVSRFQHKTPESARRNEPFGAMSVCVLDAATGKYDCSRSRRRVRSGARSREWPCKNESEATTGTNSRYGGCPALVTVRVRGSRTH